MYNPALCVMSLITRFSKHSLVQPNERADWFARRLLRKTQWTLVLSYYSFVNRKLFYFDMTITDQTHCCQGPNPSSVHIPKIAASPEGDSVQPITWQQWAFGIIVVLVGPCCLLYTVRLAGGHTLHGVMDFLPLMSCSI